LSVHLGVLADFGKGQFGGFYAQKKTLFDNDGVRLMYELLKN